MTVEELVAITPVQVRLAASVGALDKMVQSMLDETIALRIAKGIPVTEAEIDGMCDCDDCRAKVAAQPQN